MPKSQLDSAPRSPRKTPFPQPVLDPPLECRMAVRVLTQSAPRMPNEAPHLLPAPTSIERAPPAERCNAPTEPFKNFHEPRLWTSRSAAVEAYGLRGAHGEHSKHLDDHRGCRGSALFEGPRTESSRGQDCRGSSACPPQHGSAQAGAQGVA